MTQTALFTDGAKIAFAQEGKRNTIILVGGAFKHRAIDSRTIELFSLLSKHFSAIHYNRHGSGERGETRPYSVEREIEDIEALICASGSAFLFGMSSGAVLLLRATAKCLRFKKLVNSRLFRSGFRIVLSSGN